MATRRRKTGLESAVRESRAMLSRSRSRARKMVRDAFTSAQETVQSRLGSARDQATETWDNLEALFQDRVQKALKQIGMPSGDEIRLLSRRVAELNEQVQALAKKTGGRPAKSTARRGARHAPRRKVARAR